MAMNVKGMVIHILKEETGTSKAGKEWKKQDFLIETSEQFPKKVCFTLFGDKISLLNGVTEGQEVDVYFSIESRDFNGRYFHNINAWKIEVGASTTTQAPSTGLKTAAEATMPTETSEPEGNDLPF